MPPHLHAGVWPVGGCTGVCFTNQQAGRGRNSTNSPLPAWAGGWDAGKRVACCCVQKKNRGSLLATPQESRTWERELPIFSTEVHLHPASLQNYVLQLREARWPGSQQFSHTSRNNPPPKKKHTHTRLGIVLIAWNYRPHNDAPPDDRLRRHQPWKWRRGPQTQSTINITTTNVDARGLPWVATRPIKQRVTS